MIYTKTGDKGSTSLVGGTRVSKCCQRVEAYGTVDELNAHLGLAAEMMQEKSNDLDLAFDIREEFEKSHNRIKQIQNNLFIIQTLLATEDDDTRQKLPKLKSGADSEIESWIDETDSKLPKLNSFVIPGGTTISAQIHVARTVCRRAERETVRLQEEASVEEIILKYINRLSDYLFVLSRFVILLENKKENFWSVK